MPYPGRASAVAALLIVAACVGACASPRAAATGPHDAAARAATVGSGTIVAVRPVAPARAAVGAGSDVRGSILGAIGAAAADPEDDRAVEFIVREDTGRTVSVVQGNGQNLLPGERVLLTRSDRTRLVHGALPPAGA